jgi:hypothetical protein
MTTIWAALVWFWTNYHTWIILTFLPSIIAGFSISPKTLPEANFLTKVWNFLKKVCDFLSIVNHKDVGGTIKPPFTLSVWRVGRSKKTTAVTAALLSVFLLCGSCAVWRDLCGDGKVVADLIDCTTQGVLSYGPGLLPIIKAALTGESGKVLERSLGALAKEFGKDVFACTLQQAGQDLLASVPVGGETQPPQSVALEGANRARKYIAEHNYQFKTAPAMHGPTH